MTYQDKVLRAKEELESWESTGNNNSLTAAFYLLGEVLQDDLALIPKPEKPEFTVLGWTTQDVYDSIENNELKIEVTEEEAIIILQIMQDDADASLGISWDDMEDAIDKYVGDREGWKAGCFGQEARKYLNA